MLFVTFVVGSNCPVDSASYFGAREIFQTAQNLKDSNTKEEGCAGHRRRFCLGRDESRPDKVINASLLSDLRETDLNIFGRCG